MVNKIRNRFKEFIRWMVAKKYRASTFLMVMLMAMPQSITFADSDNVDTIKSIIETKSIDMASFFSGSDIVAEAEKYVGNPYVWGGSSLTEGCDCSHFTWLILKATGHYTGAYETSKGQRSWGTAVSADEVQPGDIICYNGHVAIYVDANHIVHARGKAYGIEITETDPLAYHGGYVAIRRLTSTIDTSSADKKKKSA